MSLSIADLVEAIEGHLAPLEPGIKVSVGPAAVQGTRATPAGSMARTAVLGQPGSAVVQVSVDAPTSRNRNLDREGPVPHLMTEDAITITLNALTAVSDPKGTRRAVLDAEARIIGLLYEDQFARVHRVRYVASNRSFAASTSGTQFTTTISFTRSHQ